MRKREEKIVSKLKKGLQRANEISKGMNRDSIPEDICLNSQMIEKYYDELILGTRKPRSGNEIFIQKVTRKDAGAVLVYLGLNHPASPTVLRYLADQRSTAGEIPESLYARQIYAVSHYKEE